MGRCSFAVIMFSLSDATDGAMRRATIVVCAKSGTEVPRYRMGQVIMQPVTAIVYF